MFKVGDEFILTERGKGIFSRYIGEPVFLADTKYKVTKIEEGCKIWTTTNGNHGELYTMLTNATKYFRKLNKVNRNLPKWF